MMDLERVLRSSSGDSGDELPPTPLPFVQPTDITPEDGGDAATLVGLLRCKWCWGFHFRECYLIKEITYYPNGGIRNVVLSDRPQLSEQVVDTLEELMKKAEIDVGA